MGGEGKEVGSVCYLGVVCRGGLGRGGGGRGAPSVGMFRTVRDLGSVVRDREVECVRGGGSVRGKGVVRGEKV